MEQKILQYLDQLAEVQERTQAVLSRKQESLVQLDKDKIGETTAEEKEVLTLLQNALLQRDTILNEAKTLGITADSLVELCEKYMPQSPELVARLEEAQHRIRNIRFQSLANWTMNQKSLVHLSQILELIANRGEKKATYSSPQKQENGGLRSGGLVDQDA